MDIEGGERQWGFVGFFLQEVEIRGMKGGSFKNEDNSFPKNWERIFYQTTKKVIGFVSHWISLILILNLVSPVLVFFLPIPIHFVCVVGLFD